MRPLMSWLICSMFAAVVVCPEGYVLKDEKCLKKPRAPVVIYFTSSKIIKPVKEGK